MADPYFDPTVNPNVSHSPSAAPAPVDAHRHRQLYLLIGVALLALLLIAVVWQTSGTHGAKRDLASANEQVAQKQKEVADAQRLLNQKIAELRAAQAEADVQATRLNGAVSREVSGDVVDPAITTSGTRVDPTLGEEPGLYVRTRDGRYIPYRQP